MNSWIVSFSYPLNIKLSFPDSEFAPSKDEILGQMSGFNISAYEKIQIKKCLYGLTAPWRKTNNSFQITSIHETLDKVIITVFKNCL